MTVLKHNIGCRIYPSRGVTLLKELLAASVTQQCVIEMVLQRSKISIEFPCAFHNISIQKKNFKIKSQWDRQSVGL